MRIGFLFLLLVVSAEAMAQRNVNLEASQMILPAAGDTLFLGQPATFVEVFINKGPDKIIAGDTMYFMVSGFPYWVGRVVQTSKNVNDTLMAAASLTVSMANPVGPYSFCGVGMIAAGNNLIDPDTANNRKCNPIVFFNGSTIVTEIERDRVILAPNPAKLKVEVSYPYSSTLTTKINLFDCTGKLVSAYSIDPAVKNGSNVQLDISNQAAGIYLVEVVQGKMKLRSKLVVQ